MWPKLNFGPINLWNVPYMFKELTIIDKILDEELRYYIRMNKYATLVYLGINQQMEVLKICPYVDVTSPPIHTIHGLAIIKVDKEDYLRVG